MSIETGQAILKCFIDPKSSVWFTLGSEEETVFCDTIGLITVFDAILTGRQAGVKLQCLYENPMSNNLRKTSAWKKI